MSSCLLTKRLLKIKQRIVINLSVITLLFEQENEMLITFFIKKKIKINFNLEHVFEVFEYNR